MLTFIGGAVALASVIVACAVPAEKKALVTECVLPPEQAQTLSGHWPVTPIPIAFKSGGFGTDAMGEIAKAADVWNDFFTKTRGIKVLDYGDAASPRTTAVPKPANPCLGGTIVSGSGFSGQVVIYNSSPWSYSHSAIAVTNFCTGDGSPLKNMFTATMEVNSQDFFGDAPKSPDLQSIFVHEFGHLLGLDHSCKTGTYAGFPNCNDPSMPDDYFFAVMFPVVRFDGDGIGEVRRALQPNDQGRANCLYETAAK